MWCPLSVEADPAAKFRAFLQAVRAASKQLQPTLDWLLVSNSIVNNIQSSCSTH